jgi:hypothetical protein
VLPDYNDTITASCVANCIYKNTGFSIESGKDVGDTDFKKIFFQMRISSQ